MKVLVTGAAGKLGSAVCAHLLGHGYEVTATDHKHREGLKAKLVLADLRDDIAVYGLLEGCEAVVHLGNHPNLHAGPSPQRLIAENTAMNANVFRAALDIGVRRIVFASSVQAMLKMTNGMRVDTPFEIPYLPLDGAAPANPGSNFYGLSKVFGERMLQELSGAQPELAATSLRFPGLLSEQWLERFTAGGKPAARSWFNFGEVLAYLMFSDAAELIRAVLEKQRPGYHQYYPAQTLEVRGVSAAQLIREFYPQVPLRRPIEQIDALVDVSAITEELGWAPSERASIAFAD
ncbi:MAG TPA: NAD(P)-dependent oxidoreductase [Polyangiaceae bacterium]